MSVVVFGDVEDHSMSVDLRRGVAVRSPRGVVLEGSRNEFACRLRRVEVADACLRVPLQLTQGDPHTLQMRLSHALIPAHKCSERNRLRCGERSIPTSAMLYARHFLAESSLIGFRSLMANELCFHLRVLAFGQAGEGLIAYRALKASPLGHLGLPFAMPLLVAAPVVLLLGRELPRMVRSHLACGRPTHPRLSEPRKPLTACGGKQVKNRLDSERRFHT